MHDAIPDDMYELWFIHFVRNLIAHAACKERHVEQFAAASVQNTKRGKNRGNVGTMCLISNLGGRSPRLISDRRVPCSKSLLQQQV